MKAKVADRKRKTIIPVLGMSSRGYSALLLLSASVFILNEMSPTNTTNVHTLQTTTTLPRGWDVPNH